MALKNQKRYTLRCFRASENPENAAQSDQNAGKTLLLHVRFAVPTVA